VLPTGGCRRVLVEPTPAGRTRSGARPPDRSLRGRPGEAGGPVVSPQARSSGSAASRSDSSGPERSGPPPSAGRQVADLCPRPPSAIRAVRRGSRRACPSALRGGQRSCRGRVRLRRLSAGRAEGDGVAPALGARDRHGPVPLPRPPPRRARPRCRPRAVHGAQLPTPVVLQQADGPASAAVGAVPAMAIMIGPAGARTPRRIGGREAVLRGPSGCCGTLPERERDRMVEGGWAAWTTPVAVTGRTTA